MGGIEGLVVSLVPLVGAESTAKFLDNLAQGIRSAAKEEQAEQDLPHGQVPETSTARKQ